MIKNNLHKKITLFLHCCIVPLFLLTTSGYLLTPSRVHAQESSNFKTVSARYEDTYTIKSGSDDVLVERVVKLTNKTSKYYVTDYVMSASTNARYDQLDVFEDVTKVDPKIENGVISIHFEKPAIGMGVIKKVTFRYSMHEAVKRAGESYELFIPVSKSAGNEEVEAYQITLKLPNGFQKPSLFKPYAKRISDTEYMWEDVSEYMGKNVDALFSENALYAVELHYALVNNSPFPKTLFIPLVPEGTFQKVHVTDISPQPVETQVDADGNYLAAFAVSGQEAQKVIFKGIVELSTKPRNEVVSYYRKRMAHEGLARYVTEEKYWQSTQALKGGTVKDIYDFVVNTLTYNSNRINENTNRMGAIEAMKNPDKAVCMEYTDLFIALSRERNIAAREVVGYAVTNDDKLQPKSFFGDILHAWPEFYDTAREFWRPVDPTWEDTSGVDYFSALDLNHIAFVYHGKDTTYPLPPGVYKIQENTKDVLVKPTFEIPRKISRYEITLPEKITFNAGMENTLTIILNAQTQTFGYAVSIDVVDKQSQKVLAGKQLPILEPYAHKKISFSIDSTMSALQKGTLLLRVNGTTIREVPYTVTTWWINVLSRYGVLFTLFAVVIIVVVLLKVFST